MNSFVFCIILLAFFNATQQQSFLEQKSNIKVETPIWRKLELDATSFPIVEAFLIQLGDWAFWVTVILFIGMTFLVWKEGRLYEGCNQAFTYLLLGLVICGSFYSIPFITLYGCICFWDKIKVLLAGTHSQGGAVPFVETGQEMKTTVIPEMQQPLISQEKYVQSFSSPSRQRENPTNMIKTEQLVKRVPPKDLIQEDERCNPLKSLAKTFTNLVTSAAKNKKKEIANQVITTMKNNKDNVANAVVGYAVDALSKAEPLTKFALRKPFSEEPSDRWCNSTVQNVGITFSHQWDDKFREEFTRTTKGYSGYWPPKILPDYSPKQKYPVEEVKMEEIQIKKEEE